MGRYFRVTRIFVILAVLAIGLVALWLKQSADVFVRGDVTLRVEECAVPSADSRALTLLTGYFSLRSGSFARAAHIKDAASDADSSLVLSTAVRKNEVKRVKQLRKLKNAWNCRFSGARADLRIEGWRDDGGTIVCRLYEFVWFQNWYSKYTTPESADLSGYGVRHVLRLQRKAAGEFLLLSDDYDEGRPTFAAAEGRLDNPDYIAYAGTPTEPERVNRKKAPALPVNTAEFVASYRPRDAINYANRWVAKYNRAQYPNLEPLGGDCCNFASQCIAAGGMPLTASWTHHGLETGSPTWISSTRLYAVLTGSAGYTAVGRGVAVLRMDDAAGRFVRLDGKRLRAADVLFPGSPVFYRWSGGFAQDGRWNHTALCVGTMGDGAPAISGHTADKYHIKWNYGGKTCDVGTVQLMPITGY